MEMEMKAAEGEEGSNSRRGVSHTAIVSINQICELDQGRRRRRRRLTAAAAAKVEAEALPSLRLHC